MRQQFLSYFGLFLLGALFSMTNHLSASSIYTYSLDDITGHNQPLSDYKGKVLLLVNVASQCGFTPQYEGLQSIYDAYKNKGFLVIGIPANNFGGQEPGSDENIKTFCETKFGVSFPMMSKISVKGDDMHPLYAYLTQKENNHSFSGSVKWNFTKFLINKKGEVIARFGPMKKPTSKSIKKAIEQAIDETI